VLSFFKRLYIEMMYYLIYGFLYTISLLPWWVLYLLSDVVYGILYYIIQYRREVVMNNLLIAFPEKTVEERTKIAKEFYHNFLDTFIETLKFLSLSDKGFSKRIAGNFELLSEIYATGKNVQLHSGHFFNWEYMNWGLSRNIPFPLVGVYAPIENKAFQKVMLKLRGKYKPIQVSTEEFKTRFHQIAKDRFALALIADQNPGIIQRAYWLPFFGRLTPFVTGPEKTARIYDTTVVFAHFYKEKRGFYRVNFEVFTDKPRETVRGEITKGYAAYLEKCIRSKPANYLWSHRRWKHDFKEEYGKLVI
jgi:KDO2-lipid IV(A) lauroyltransferase